MMASKANVGNIYEKILCEAQICKQFYKLLLKKYPTQVWRGFLDSFIRS